MPIESLTVAVLVGMLAMGTIASCGWDHLELRNRESWWWTGILAAEVVLMPNPYAGALLATVLLGLFQIGKSWYILRSFTIPVAAVSGAYLFLSSVVQAWMIAPVLWAGVAIGGWLGLYVLMGWWIGKPIFLIDYQGWIGRWIVFEGHTDVFQREEVRTLYAGRFGTLTWYETMNGFGQVTAGQTSMNHLAAVQAWCCACAMGLIVMGYAWTWLAAPLLLLPLIRLHCPFGAWHWHPHQGDLSLLAIAFGCWLLWEPWSALVIGAVAGLGLVIYARPWNPRTWQWWDSYRLTYWKDALTLVWWPQGWPQRLFGFGSSTWYLATWRMGEARHHHVFTAAHNEFLQQLVEHGIVGLLVMLAYVGEALCRTYRGGPEGHAVFLLGLAWVAIATVSFPASWYHEHHPASSREEHWYGSPTLNLWTFMIAVLAEAV